MRRHHAPFKELNAFFVARFWVDCITNISGFDLGQAQPKAEAKIARDSYFCPVACQNDFGTSKLSVFGSCPQFSLPIMECGGWTSREYVHLIELFHQVDGKLQGREYRASARTPPERSPVPV